MEQYNDCHLYILSFIMRNAITWQSSRCFIRYISLALFRYVKRDKLRFDLADQDADGSLQFEEFTAFLHPEEFSYMAG